MLVYLKIRIYVSAESILVIVFEGMREFFEKRSLFGIDDELYCSIFLQNDSDYWARE